MIEIIIPIAIAAGFLFWKIPDDLLERIKTLGYKDEKEFIKKRWGKISKEDKKMFKILGY